MVDGDTNGGEKASTGRRNIDYALHYALHLNREIALPSHSSFPISSFRFPMVDYRFLTSSFECCFLILASPWDTLGVLVVSSGIILKFRLSHHASRWPSSGSRHGSPLSRTGHSWKLVLQRRLAACAALPGKISRNSSLQVVRIRQVVHARQRFWMFLAQHLLSQLECLSMY